METKRTAWLFPGQGSQFVGMGRELLHDFDPAVEILNYASELSGCDLKRLILQGPESELMRTDRLQPALTAINLGCTLLLIEKGRLPNAVAGHSLGEFAALYAAGVLELKEVLDLVTFRGRLMHEAAGRGLGGMMAVMGLTGTQVEEIVSALEGQHWIGIANYNATTQTVLSGERFALEKAERMVHMAGGRTVALKVSGPWHSLLLHATAERFSERLTQVTFRPPQVPVYFNVTGSTISAPDEIRVVLGRQLASPVRWAQSMEALLASGVTEFIEVGPGKVLRGLLRHIGSQRDDVHVVGFDGPKALKFLERPRAA